MMNINEFFFLRIELSSLLVVSQILSVDLMGFYYFTLMTMMTYCNDLFWKFVWVTNNMSQRFDVM